MKPFLKRKYVKIPVVSLVLCSLLMQFVPAPQPAQAFSVKDILKKILAVIQPPSELELTSDGGIEFGSWLAKKHFGGQGDLSVFNCLFKQQPEPGGSSIDLKFCGCQIRNGLKCGWRDNNDCRADCPNYHDPNCGGENVPCCLRAGEECVNPFSTFRFGHHESQTALKDENDRLTIPNPKTPLRCQLKIPLPDEDDTTTIEEKLAERKACNYFRSVQKAAAQVAYTAKQIFNNTDPLSKCFFLRNCKTSCSFRFGSVTYIITLLDIVRLFVGDASVALDVVQKIINIVRIFRALLEIGEALKDLYQEGVDIVSNLLDTVKNLATLGSSLQEIGVKISDAFVFTPVAMGTGYTEERVKKAYNGFVDLISNFASNLEKYQIAKSEALALVDRTKEDVALIMEEPAEVNGTELAGFKNEPEIGFLFVKKKDPANPTNYEKKMELDKIVANYQAMFRPISEVFEQIAMLGDMFDGQSFSGLTAGTEDEWYEKSAKRHEELCVPGSIWSFIPGKCGFEFDFAVPGETFEEFKQRVMRTVENFMPDDIKVNSSTDRTKYIYMNGRLLTKTYIPQELDLATQHIVFDEIFFDDLCTANNCWYQDNGGEFCNVYTFVGDRVVSYPADYKVEKGGNLLNTDYIRGIIYQSLGGDYKLDFNDKAWREYWEKLAQYCRGDAWVQDQIDRWIKETTHRNMLNACTVYDDGITSREDWPGLQTIRSLDENSNTSKTTYKDVWNNELGGYESKAFTEVNKEYIENKIQAYKNYIPSFSFGTEAGEGPWFETFQEIFKDVQGFRDVFKFLTPDYIRIKVIGSALGGYDCDEKDDNCQKFAYERLDESKDAWRWYWEDLGRIVLIQGRVDNIIKDNNMEDAHNKIRGEVIDVVPVLKLISNLNGGGKYDKDEGFNDSRIKDAFETIAITITDPVTGETTEFHGYNEAFKEYFETRPDQTAKIETIKYHIDILEQQGEDLSSRADERTNPYWESRLWCSKPISSYNWNINPEEQYKDSFEGAVVDYDWEKRIELVVGSKPILDVIKSALEYKLGPSQPLLIFYITRAQDKLVQLAKLFQETIKELLCGKDLDCNADEAGADRGLLAERNTYCYDVDKRCAGEKDIGEYGDYCEWKNWYGCYENNTSYGNKDCLSLPTTPTCSDWIGSCDSCEECRDNCYDNCSPPCDRYLYRYCYECDDADDSDDDGEVYCDSKRNDARNDCEGHCQGGRCDSEHDYRYDCPFTASKERYTTESGCEGVCKRPNCDSESDCEKYHCSDSNEACGLRDNYKKKSTAELNRLDAECARRERYSDYLGSYLSGALDYADELDIDFAPIIQAFENKFEPLKDALKDLQKIWDKEVFVDRESTVASSTVHKIVNTIAKSKEIVEDILPGIEAALTDLGVLDQAEQYLNFGYCGVFDRCDATHTTNCCDATRAASYRCAEGTAHANCEEVSTKTWNKFLLNDPDNPDNSGIIVRFKKEAETAKQQIVNTIKEKAGQYQIAPGWEVDNYNESSLCPDNIEELGFLDRVACFEKRNNRLFSQLLDFISVVEGLENVSFAMDDLKENIIDLEPSIDMQVVDGLKDKLDSIGENPISLLDDVFDAIRRIFRELYSLPLSQNGDAYLNKTWNRVGILNVFGKNSDSNRRQAYQNAIKNLHQENITDLKGLIFREDDITKGCEALSMVLNSDPRETRDNCLAQEKFFTEPLTLIGTEIDDFNDINSKQKCRNLGELDLSLFEEDQQKAREELIAEKIELIERREKIKEVRCSNPTKDTFISCPKRFCLDPATGAHGVGAMQKDLYCQRLCADWQPEQNTGYVCDFDNNIIWDASKAPPAENTDRVETSTCQDAGLPDVCAVSELDAKCQEFESKVRIQEFDNPLYGFDVAENSAKIEALENERACITYEECSDDYGSADELYNYPIAKTAQQHEGEYKPCISCPNWICENFDNSLLTVDDPHCVNDPAHNPILGGALDSNAYGDNDDTYRGIVWDTALPNRLMKWPRPTACFADKDGNLPPPEQMALDNHLSQVLTTQLCIKKQKELKDLLETTPAVIVFPWDEEDWPCKTKDTCEALNRACEKLDDNTAVAPSSGWNQWPPTDPCDDQGYVLGYVSAKAECIRTQQKLEGKKYALDENDDFDWVTEELINQCDELAIQKSLKKECEHFNMLENNVFPDKCGALPHCSSNETDDYLKGRIVVPCQEFCKFIHDKAWDSFCESLQQGIEPVLSCGNSMIPWRRDIPNLTLPTPGNKPEEELDEDELAGLNELRAGRTAVIEKCELATYNIEQPLDEIMKIFAILLGIKSATGLYSGVQILKSSTQKIIQDVKDFIAMIKGTPCEDGSECVCGECEGSGGCSGGIIKDLQCLWKQIDEGLGGGDQGLKVKALECESHPAVSYSTTKEEKLTSNQGGPVCPGVSDLFQQIEGQFGVARQNVQQIDLVRRGVKEGGFSIGRLNIHLWTEYPIIYNSFNDLYEAAESIRTRTSYVWALANAVNFANQQCSCGQSYCKMPLCVSGLPLAFAPVKNPYCYIVWIFRHPMLKVADKLGEFLEQQVK